MGTMVKYYTDHWFKVVYEIEESRVFFKAWRIIELNESNVESSKLERSTPNITGFIKQDGCMEFEQTDHYCGLHHVYQLGLLMEEIYKFKDDVFNSDILE